MDLSVTLTVTPRASSGAEAIWRVAYAFFAFMRAVAAEKLPTVTRLNARPSTLLNCGAEAPRHDRGE